MMASEIEQEFEPDEGLVVLTDPNSLAANRYQMLFAKVDAVCRKQEKKIIAVTSSIKGEGKTTTTANLAVIMSREFSKRCLVIDGDFRNPSLGKLFKAAPDTLGLADVIAKKCRIESAIKQGATKNLALLTTGQLTKQENNIWTSEEIKVILAEVRKWFDYILIDAPPILPLCDVSVLSELVDGILVVVRAGETPEALVSQALSSLGSNKVIGTILNRAKVNWPSRYYQYGY
jgi:capsular exopolysaccharide synthesis family protein